MPHRKQTQPGDILHIYSRGVDKRKIFLNKQDYLRFILALYILNDANNKYDVWSSLKFNKNKTLAVLQSYGNSSTTGSPEHPVVEDSRDKFVDLLAFALMPNHYHLILRERGHNNISAFMRKIGAGYARYFNEQNERSGALFEGRYKDVHIKDERQLLTIFNYVHTNPVELVEAEWKYLRVKDKNRAMNYLNDYKWSSYRDYVGASTFPFVTDRSFYTNFFGSVNDCTRSVEDWISFKAENAELDSYLLKI